MFVVVSAALAPRVRRALAQLEGYPVRGTCVGGPDFTSDVPGSAGWTTDAAPNADIDGAQACIDLPDGLLKYCGHTVTVSGQTVTLPTLAQLVDNEASLPASLRAVRAAKRAQRAP